jgi:hypothetical protein
MMVLYFRAWAENYAAGATGFDAANGWDNVDCLGLSFNGIFPTRDGAAARGNKLGFVGLCQATTSALHKLDLVAAPGASWPGDVVEWKAGEALAGAATAPNTLLPGATLQQLRLPHGALGGAQFTGVWIFKRSPGQQIACSFGRNFESLAPAEISLALTSPATIWDAQDQLTTETTNWRPTEETMQFPTTFLAKYTSGELGCRMVLDHLKVEFWKFNA